MTEIGSRGEIRPSGRFFDFGLGCGALRAGIGCAGRAAGTGSWRTCCMIRAVRSAAGVQMCAQRLLLRLRQLAVKQLTDLQPVMLTGVHTSAPPFVCFDA